MRLGIRKFGKGAVRPTQDPSTNKYFRRILSAALKAAAVQGDLGLGIDFKGQPVSFGDMLGD